ncbi:MAG: hypothetical protein KatS3mg131_3923 [Candidatus Tectimicrobiota bacterium]|nr:MAG: hypothetical protein KatS3mg131_3923 [Candidatus Tectomicrobia bacterium]
MWIPGGMMYVITFLILLACLLDYEEQQVRQRQIVEG